MLMNRLLTNEGEEPSILHLSNFIKIDNLIRFVGSNGLIF